MKRIFQTSLAILALTFIISACSTPQNTSAGTSSGNVSRGKFVGTWTLTNVTYDGLVQGAVQNVFDQAPPEAFVGSTWKFTNSGNGIYTLSNGASQTIFWSVFNGTQFQFKKLYQGDKAKNVQEGYRLDIGVMNGTSMTLRSPVAIGNSNGYIIYSFTKAN
ncbi:lipocalin family protein [Mucilaginibacter phyllosphaerae]|uniref:Uncharacterized protein n=1 Tax=Mucilaginibacter phyllosphaerae TaxID=1812349 RepID=A0A4Y8A9R8_9SPHI|nr:lipocalin family protein [Mucilaginibacter phyllosphaerae]MBB3969751.1 hypothetical protein [Mucilaginibacter phyllosphaerae]TEW65133.1 hypothetical protein E2R65_14550 [Mucilaginibacter phyllosphaerae]GGH17759.1 hypothetical protein GCM10007352_28080 [Mucilaginibacter phyllosphaerae]